LGDEIRKKETGGERSTMGREEEHTGVWWENLTERDHLKESGVDGRIKLKWILRK
jgi:hypothetical protein